MVWFKEILFDKNIFSSRFKVCFIKVPVCYTCVIKCKYVLWPRNNEIFV